MTQFEKDVYNNLSSISERLGKIETKLNADYAELHGNGKPGLIKEVETINRKLTAIDVKNTLNAGVVSTIIGILAWIITTVIAIYGAFKHGG